MGTKKRKPAKAKPKVAPRKRKPAAKTKPKVSPRKRKPVAKAKPKVAPRKRKSVAKAKPKAAPRKRKPVAKIERLEIGKPIVKRELQSSNWSQVFDSAMLPEIFSNVLTRYSRKGPFEPDDILVFNHGIKFLGHKPLPREVEKKLLKLAKGSHIKLKSINTNIGHELFIFLGNIPKLTDGVQLSFHRRKKALQAIADELDAYWGDFDWWLWFETEESLYE